MTLADKIAVLDKGHLEQLDAPLNIYEKPLSRFVASFIGTPAMNLVSKDDLSASDSFKIPTETKTIGIRAEAIGLSATSEANAKLGSAQVRLIEPLGSATHVHLRMGKSTVLIVVKPGQAPQLGAAVNLFVNPKSLFYYDQQDHLL